MSYLVKRLLFRLKRDGFLTVIKLFFLFIFFKNKKIDLDKLNLSKDLSLDGLFLTFGTDKGMYDGKKTFYKLHKDAQSRMKFSSYREWVLRKNIHEFDYEMGQNFSSVYETYFEKIKEKKLKILEIGVAGGHSHATWYHYFSNSQIYGIDIRPKNHLLYEGSRLKYFQIDCTDQKKINNFKKLGLDFDIIIDDSLHNYTGFITNLINFFPLLKKGGYYFLEDFSTSDNRLKNQRLYNEKFGKKLQGHHLTMDEIFNFLKDKTFFESRFFDKVSQEYLHKNISELKTFYLDYPESSIALLRKVNEV